MEAYRALRDGQAQSYSPGQPSPGIVQPIERLKELFQSTFRDTRSAVRHSHAGLGTTRSVNPLQLDLSASSLARVADGIAHHVLYRAVQQRRVAAHVPISFRNRAANMTVPLLRLKLGILGNIQHKFVQWNRRGRHFLLAVFEASQGENPPDQLVEAAGLKFNALQHLGALLSRALPRQSQSHVQAGKGRA